MRIIEAHTFIYRVPLKYSNRRDLKTISTCSFVALKSCIRVHCTPEQRNTWINHKHHFHDKGDRLANIPFFQHFIVIRVDFYIVEEQNNPTQGSVVFQSSMF